MSENKFLKNLSQQAPPPAEAPAGPDPIQRLTAELSRQSETIEALTDVIKRLQSQPRPATYEQVKALAGQAPQLDAAAVADQLRPALVAAQPVAPVERARRWYQGEFLGFTSLWSMAGILGFVLLLMFVLGWGGFQQQAQIESWQQQALQARQELQAHQQFVDWLSKQKPYKNALKQYNRQLNNGEKKR
jgi:hypothetical protein